jgi:hypothetical protein
VHIRELGHLHLNLLVQGYMPVWFLPPLVVRLCKGAARHSPAGDLESP